MNIYAARITTLNEDGTPGETVTFGRCASVECWVVDDTTDEHPKPYGYVIAAPPGWSAQAQREAFDAFDEAMAELDAEGDHVDVPATDCQNWGHQWDAREYYDVCLNCDERRTPVIEVEKKL